MSDYYNSQRQFNLYHPGLKDPFRISRSKISDYIDCPHCFYLDRRLGVARPPGFPFSLNSAVDKLLKKEFDIHRAKGDRHPLMKAYGIDAIPYQHDNINVWRDAMRGGIRFLHTKTNLLITGGVDDIWINSGAELIIVDYKATSKTEEVSLDALWQDGYKRQMEIYQWLFRRNGFRVNDTGYFVYCNGRTDAKAFDARLEFDIKLLPYKGDDSWIEETLTGIKKCLDSDTLPPSNKNCDYCNYRESAKTAEKIG